MTGLLPRHRSGVDDVQHTVAFLGARLREDDGHGPGVLGVFPCDEVLHHHQLDQDFHTAARDDTGHVASGATTRESGVETDCAFFVVTLSDFESEEDERLTDQVTRVQRCALLHQFGHVGGGHDFAHDRRHDGVLVFVGRLGALCHPRHERLNGRIVAGRENLTRVDRFRHVVTRRRYGLR